MGYLADKYVLINRSKSPIDVITSRYPLFVAVQVGTTTEVLEIMESILRCEKCNKPFDKGRSYHAERDLARPWLTILVSRGNFEEAWILLSDSKGR